MSTDAAGQAAKPLGDTFHNGGIQGANKSFLSYRLGLGVPGYTGLTPVHECLEVPVKAGVAARAPLDRGDAPGGDGGTIKAHLSTTKAAYGLTPQQYKDGTAPNPLWDVNARRPIGDPPYIRRPVDDIDRNTFAHGSTFRGAYCIGAEEKNQDYPTNVTPTGTLRPPTVPPGPPANVPHFYLTETQQKQEEGSLYMAIKKVMPPAPEPKQRANRQLTGVALHEPVMRTTYRDCFGAYGVDPQSKLPADKTQFSLKASTAEHYQGTTKASYHPPGYSGFIPETGRNPHATAQGMGVDPRISTKRIELQTLFQYPHHLPGYAGYQPQTAINDCGPNRNESLTTSGRDNILGTNGFRPGDLGLSMKTLAPTAPNRSVFGKTGSIKKEVFSHESLTGAISDNGRHEAEMYYRTTRPLEGRSVAIIHQGHWNNVV